MAQNSAFNAIHSLEVEQKYRLEDAAAFKDQLTALGACWESPIQQTDLYFNHPAKDFKQTDEALRIRTVGEQNWVTYKGPKLDHETKTRREIEVPLASGKTAQGQFAEVLQLLGFRPVWEVRKTRLPGTLIWQGVTVTLALDSLAADKSAANSKNTLGDFLELELVVPPEELALAKGHLADLATHLNLSQPERRSYLELLLEQSPQAG